MKIGIVGGIGSGKSTVSNILRELGYMVIDCDAVYKDITNEKEYIDLIDKTFPRCAIDGQIDRTILGNQVFNDKNKLAQLNSLAHPLVLKRLDEIINNQDKDVFIEVQVVDDRMKNYLDKILFVSSDVKFRIQRVMARSGYSKEYVKKIIASQTSNEEYEKMATYIVLNNKGPLELRQQLIRLFA